MPRRKHKFSFQGLPLLSSVASCGFWGLVLLFLWLFFHFSFDFLHFCMGSGAEHGHIFWTWATFFFDFACSFRNSVFSHTCFFQGKFCLRLAIGQSETKFSLKNCWVKKNVEKKAKVRVWLPAQDWVLIFWPSLQTFVRGCVLDINNTSSFFSHLAMLFQDPLTAFGNAGHKFVSRDVITDCLLCLLLESFKGIVWIPKFAQLCLCPWPHILLGIQIRRMRWIFWKRFDTKLPQSLFCLWRMKHLLAVKQYLEGLPVWESRPQEWAQTSPDNFCKCCRSPFFLAHGD